MIYYGILLFFVLEYVRPGSYIPGINLIRLNTLVPLAVVFGSLVLKGKSPKPTISGERNTKIVLFLLGMVGFSVLYAELSMTVVTVFTTILGYSLIYWVLAREITTIGQMKGIFAVLILVHLILAALTPQMFTDPGTRHYIAAATFLGDGNDYALSVDIAIPFALFLLLDSRSILAKIVYAGMLAVLLFCVVASQSRGGTIALVAMGMFYWWKSDKKIVTGALAVAVVAAVLAFAPGNYFQRMQKLTNVETDGSAQGRIAAWQAGAKMALFNPLGVGAGNFPANYTRYTPNSDETRWKTAHSIYFLILGELGIIGLGMLIFFIVSNIVDNGRAAKQLLARPPTPETATGVRLMATLSASMLAYAVAGAFLSATYYPHIWVLGGLIVAARRLVLAELAAAPAPQVAAPAIVCHPAIRATLSHRRIS